MKKLLCLITLLNLGLPAVRAQDIHFSQFYENASLRNPALTGIFSGDYKVSVNYRNQWSGFSVPFITAMISAETKVLVQEQSGDYLSFGLTAVHDQAGSINFASSAAYGAVNYNKSLGDEANSYLSVGLCGAYLQRSVDPGKMRFANQYLGGSYLAGNPSGEQTSATKLSHFDVSAGVSFNSTIRHKVNFYIGLAGFHIAKPKETFLNQDFVRLTTRWSGNFGLRARLSDKVGLTLHANYQYQEPYQELIGGGLLSYQTTHPESGQQVLVSAGCFYRWADAIIPTVRLDYKNWSLTASYDVTVGSNRIYFQGVGGYELSLTGRGRYRNKNQPTMACPRFEVLESESGY